MQPLAQSLGSPIYAWTEYNSKEGEGGISYGSKELLEIIASVFECSKFLYEFIDGRVIDETKYGTFLFQFTGFANDPRVITTAGSFLDSRIFLMSASKYYYY